MTKVTVFACTRTGLADRSLPDGVRLLQMPCTGRVSVPLLLAAIAQGSDGVLVLGRHQETCRLRGAEEPARDRTQRAAELLGMAGFGGDRIRFANPEPGLGSPLLAVRRFARSIAALNPRPHAVLPPEQRMGAEGLDTSLELLRWFAAHPGADTSIQAWLQSRALPVADDGASPVLVAGIVPMLDRLSAQLTRPFRLSELLGSALGVLTTLVATPAGILSRPWVAPGTDQARKLAANKHVFTLCQRGKEKLAAAGVSSTIMADLLRDRASSLPRPPVRARVATDGTDAQNTLVEALGYEPVQVGPDPLPDTFTLSPEHRLLANKRLADAEARGASALLVPGPFSYTRWAMLARHGTWQSARVAPIMAHALAHLALQRVPLSLRSLEYPLAGSSREVAS